jgi:hypothetical protein
LPCPPPYRIEFVAISCTAHTMSATVFGRKTDAGRAGDQSLR